MKAVMDDDGSDGGEEGEGGKGMWEDEKAVGRGGFKSREEKKRS